MVRGQPAGKITVTAANFEHPTALEAGSDQGLITGPKEGEIAEPVVADGIFNADHGRMVRIRRSHSKAKGGFHGCRPGHPGCGIATHLFEKDTSHQMASASS